VPWQGSVLNAVSCSVLLSTYEKSKQPERAMEVFHVVQWQGLVSTVITYNALINAFDKGKQPAQGLKVFEAMK